MQECVACARGLEAGNRTAAQGYISGSDTRRGHQGSSSEDTASQFHPNSMRISYYCEYLRECFYICSFVVLNMHDRESVVRNALQRPLLLFEPIAMARGFLSTASGGRKMAEQKPEENRMTRDTRKGVRRGYV
ncbi:MAG: hypothetical protein O3C59_10615 [Proteobacteria bacterium]|nr:hypothetical protein [Pseudomonadota bacterium]